MTESKKKKGIEPGIVCFLFSTRYWEEEEILQAFEESKQAFVHPSYPVDSIDFHLITDENGFEGFMAQYKGKGVVLVPMSGGVQPWMLRIGRLARFVVLVNGCYQNFFSDEIRYKVIEKNASPAMTDTYAVLKRMGVKTYFVNTREEAMRYLKTKEVLNLLRKSVILSAGEPEPWVLSSVRSGKRIEDKFGITVKTLPLDEIEELYKSGDDVKAKIYADAWLEKANALIEPNEEDVRNAAKLQSIFIELLQQYEADCFCTKCFELIGRINTTACLALSFLNSSAVWCGACEGDLDSAVSLLVMRKLTGKNPWMANPIVMEKDKLILSHCSAPVTEEGPLPLTLRSHHESGKGVSTEVSFPLQKTVTLMRIGNHMESIQYFTGIAEKIPDIRTCRTRLQIQVEGLEDRMSEILGCHFTLVYGDFTKELRVFAKLADLHDISYIKKK